MSIAKTFIPNWKIALGIPGIIFIACFLITLTVKFKVNPELLSNAILSDLLIVAPLIYFLVIRKTKISRLTVARVFMAGLIVAGFILPAESNLFLHSIKYWISPFVEAVVIFFVAKKFYIAGKKTNAINKSKPDFLLHCRAVMIQVLGNEKLGNIIATEIAVLYYSFLGSPNKKIDNKTRFSLYKENGIETVLWAILSLFIIETVGTHLLLGMWSRILAWVFTGLSFYTCLQIFAHIRAVKARPIIINPDSLEIHNGLAGDAYISFDNIESFEVSKKIPAGRNAVKIALLKKMENHNIIVFLKKPIEVTRIFGIKKTTDAIMFYVDQSNEFANSLSSKLEGKLRMNFNDKISA